MKQLRTAFITGFLILVPLLATVQLLLWLIQSIDQNIRAFIPGTTPLNFWGSGILLAVTTILVVGFLMQNYIGTWLVNLFDAGIKRVALVGGIYSAIKKFLETILTPGGDQFHGTCLVEFPRKGVYSIGFRTGKPDAKLLEGHKAEKLVNIFVPCTPNPTSGFYLLVPEDDLLPLNLSVQEAFKIVISMGIVTSSEELPKGSKKKR